MPKIRDVKTFITCPDGINLVVVKVETDEPGLYGLGCATFTQRCQAVKTLIDEHLKPLVVGREASEIQELWNLMYQNAYWRNGPVINNAVAGIDIALWDIKGKMASMPVYQLLGGKCREALTLYRYANGGSREEILDKAQRLWEEGFHHIRLQYMPMNGYPQMQREWKPDGAKDGFYQDPHAYMRETVGLFEHAREKMGFEPEFIHDVHERISISDGICLAKELEPMKLYFLEDLFSPEQVQAYGELKKNGLHTAGLRRAVHPSAGVEGGCGIPLHRLHTDPYEHGGRDDAHGEMRSFLRALRCENRLARPHGHESGGLHGADASGTGQP